MVSKISHAIEVLEGKYVVMPPWKEGQEGWGDIAVPNVVLAGGNTTQQLPVHTKFVDFDRRFVYGYTESVYVSGKSNLGLFNTNVEEVITFGSTAGVVNDTTLGVLTPTTDETTAAANIFAGGYFHPRTNPYTPYRVVSNTAYASGVVEASGMDIVIESPGLGAAITASQASCHLDRNPYTAMDCQWAGGNSSQSVVGVTLILPTASTYQWVQTAGPCMLYGDEAAGKAAYLRTVWWHIDGSVVAAGQGTPTDTHQPVIAGYEICLTSATYCWFIMMNPLDGGV